VKARYPRLPHAPFLACSGTLPWSGRQEMRFEREEKGQHDVDGKSQEQCVEDAEL
jgi:hypothetical protein